MTIYLPINLPFGVVAVTVWPLILCSHRVKGATWAKGVLDHEYVHLAQQRRWAVYGLGVGLLAWWALYCLVLPVGWNYWRRKWETEAYGLVYLDAKSIDEQLRGAPYWLWW